MEHWDLPERSHHLHLMTAPSLKVGDCWMELHMQAVMHCEVPYLGHNVQLVLDLEFPPEVETSTVASSRLVQVEVSQSLFQSLGVEGLQIFACRLSVGSKRQFVSCMHSSAHWQPATRNLSVEKSGSIDLHLISLGEVRQSIP